jgi:hypothetical protein
VAHDLQFLARALGGEVNGGEVLAPGPGHSANDRSLSVKIAADDFVVHSFAGDDPIACKDYVRAKAGIPAFKPNCGSRRHRASVAEINTLLAGATLSAESEPAKGRIVTTYPYKDTTDALLYEVVRFDPKDFRQRRPDGNGGWIWNLNDTPRVLYRLPELLQYPDAAVFVAEGEKDADRVASLGHCATTVAGGKWTEDCVKPLAGRDVLIFEDSDDAGRKKALDAATSLHGAAKTVRIVRLPDLPDKGDVSDWLDADLRNADKLVEVCFAVPLWPAEMASTVADLSGAFTFLGDAPATPPRELIKKLLPAYGVAVTGGQPSAGKTFIEMHKAVCLAKALPFFGHKIVERVGTAFVAAEGRALIPNRFAAALMKQSITEKLPIAWINQLPDFSSADGIKLFIQQLKALNERFQGEFGVRLGQVPIDTVAASFNMKDEDDNAEATKVCNIMRTIGEEVGALMAPVHHYGKNPESGLRGASAWKASADIVEGVLADIDPLSGRASNRELVCAKARDGEQGPISPFELEFVALGHDAEGEVYGSCCVVPVDGKASRFDQTAARSKGQRAIQDAIIEALDGRGKFITPRADMAPVRAAKVIDVREEFDRRYVVDETDPARAAAAKRMAFKRTLDRLSPTQFGAGSAEGTDWIWKIT